MRHLNPTVAGLGMILALAGVFQVGCASHSAAGKNAGVTTKEQQAAMTPDAVLAELKAGNARFVSGHTRDYDLLKQAKVSAAGQYPTAIVLGCLDSRVPPEMVFDQGIGNIFVGRVAGNFVNTDLLGSMEFGSAVVGAKLIVVLGHDHCGAIKGAIDQAKLGNLTATLANIKVDTTGIPGERSSSNEALVEAVTEDNVRQNVKDIQTRSPVLAERVRNGQLKIVGGLYDLETGRVTWLD
jgi:carbonic anhydrase